jgi:hypothetical protein
MNSHCEYCKHRLIKRRRDPFRYKKTMTPMMIDDGIRVRPVHHCHPAPVNQPPVYEENVSDDEYFTN